MVVIRPVEENDVGSLVKLAKLAGEGLTTFPPDPKVMEERIALSIKSFHSKAGRPGQEYYFLVME